MRSRARSGMTLLEVTIAITVVSMILIGSASAFLGTLQGARDARRTSRVGIYVRSVMEDVAGRSYDELPALNGTQVYDQGTQGGSAFVVGLSVFPVTVDLLQIRAIARDAITNRELGRVTTLRSRR